MKSTMSFMSIEDATRFILYINLARRALVSSSFLSFNRCKIYRIILVLKGSS